MIAIILSALALVVAAVALFFALKPREKEVVKVEVVGDPFFEVKYTPDGKYLLLSNKYKGLHVQGFISCNDK